MTADLPVSFAATAERALHDLDPSGPVEELAHHAREMSEAMVARGEACPVGEGEDYTDLECRLTHFVWAERAKHFLLLYRDVQLQLQMAELRRQEGKASQASVEDLYRRSRETLAEALRDWEADHEARRQALERNDKQRRRQLNAWKLQHNPWPLYRYQLREIAGQSTSLAAEYTELTKLAERFTDLRKLLQQILTVSNELTQRAQQRAEEIIAFIREGDTEADRPGVVAARLEDHVNEEATPARLDHYTNRVNALIAGFVEKQRVTVGSEGGLLQYKEVNFRRATDQWVSAEVMPLIYELWELSEQINNGLRVAVANVRNRALLLATEIKAGQEVSIDNNQLAQPLAAYLTKTEERSTQFGELRQRLQSLIERDLRLTSVYRPEEDFLPLPLQSGIGVFTRRQGRLVTSAQEWLQRHAAGVSRLLGAAAREEKLSVSEKTVRVIRQRSLPPDNAAYTNILMTRGYIGESFLVGREAETAHLRELIQNWKLGFRGAVLLTGNRLAGKTLFGELITNRFFAGKTIRLRPHAPLTVQGRRTQTTANLREALNFVEKYTVQQRPLLWIDDLEKWADGDHTLAANVRALGEHIDDYSGRIFYLVSTSNAVYHHLNRFQELGRVFQARISLDKFSQEDMIRAVSIRHGATHKLLVDADGEPVSEAAFAKMVKRIYRATDGNVGETINRWAYYTRRYDEERVTQARGRRYNLPAFLSPDTATLLTTILLEKQVRDYRLRKLFGPAYQERYASILQRLVRIGLVTRQPDGQLEITESVVNDIGRMLDAESYLNQSS
ncbi:hypothetical protein GGR26_000713 [Lewinella marina]|uniref:Uncharacterized protein n=1 Tax=Neolewinella marina TaxID=438751 RepID=A0A2G0CIR8_9BACT|nr:hypothetical protein [Neolewinella marina]NJB84968.1 hypothetical protein [Neolewinella marina]PHK99881.1 hypothetical protein CGL56_02215 [Neolewinella marina]